jgi:hypothetical protein
MSINRSTWYRLVATDSIPGFPCPHCATGKLKCIDKVVPQEPKYAGKLREENDWDPDYQIGRWSAVLKCDENSCGELVSMIGDTEMVEVEVEVGDGVDLALEEVLRIRAAFPGPPLFSVSSNVPHQLSAQLRLAFQMYWTDPSACVARLRTAVEMLLDQQGVPRERKLTQGKNAGKMHRMDLNERINSFTSGASHTGQLHGLRTIGNLGTHGTDKVDDEDLFDAMDVLEFVLTGIYDTKTINAKAAKLATKKPTP